MLWLGIYPGYTTSSQQNWLVIPPLAKKYVGYTTLRPFDLRCQSGICMYIYIYVYMYICIYIYINIYHFNTSDGSYRYILEYTSYTSSRDISWYIPWEPGIYYDISPENPVVMVTIQGCKLCFNVHIYTFPSLYSIFGQCHGLHLLSTIYHCTNVFIT